VVLQLRHARVAAFLHQEVAAVRRVVRQEAHPVDQVVHLVDHHPVEVAAGNNKSFLYLFNPLKF